MADLDTLASQLSQLSVREAIQLVKKLIDGAGAGSHAQHQHGLVSVMLQSCGYNKISVIKAVREVTSLGLKEAKDLVESAPSIVRADLPLAEAESIVRKLIEAGASAHVQG